MYVKLPNDIGSLAIWVVVAAAVIALVYVALVQFGITVPAWVVTVLWIVGVACVVIMAIRFLTGKGPE